MRVPGGTGSVDLPAVYMAQFCARSAKIMRSQVIQLHPFGTSPDHIPYDILRDAFAPRRSVTADRPKDPTSGDFGRDHPTIPRLFNPVGHRYSANVAALADQIHNGPMSLPDLLVLYFQGGQLGTS